MKSIYIIPCFNEESNIEKLINNCIEINKKKDSINFLLVDNGSKDRTREEIRLKIKGLNFISTLNIDENVGYGNGVNLGVVTALKEENFYKIGWSHADLQIPMESILEIDNLAEEYSTKTRDYYLRGRRMNRPSIVDKMFTVFMAIYTSLVHRSFFWDITGLPVVANRELIEKIIVNAPKGFAFDVHTYVKAKKYRAKISRIEVRFLNRNSGVSSWNTGLRSKINMSIYYLKAIRKIN